MNSRGIFCFLLLLAFAALEARFFAEAAEASRVMGEANGLAFEAERIALARALMENSVDAAIEEGLSQGLLLDLGPEEIKGLVNSRLSLVGKEMEKESCEGIVVRFLPESLEPGFLNSNSSMVVARLGKKEVVAEYCFTGGIMKSNKVLAEISGKNVKLFFIVPAGYCVKAEGVG